MARIERPSVTTTADESERRRAGVCLHLTSLPGRRGIGELGAPALGFLDWMTAHGLSVWQFLPFGPTGHGNSPYQPLSVFAGNPMLIDLDTLAGWGLLDRDEALPPAAAPEDRVDYARVSAAKGPLLSRAAVRFRASGDPALRDEFDSFCAANDGIWLDDFAAFVVLRASNGGADWAHWATADQPRSRIVGRIARDYPAEWERVKTIQFFFARQWKALRQAARERGILLFGDVPIYLALDCAEAWARPDLLALDRNLRPTEVSGVPPDYFSADGQLWGNPVYRWEAHAEEGFAWWIARLRHSLESADIVRLDHFRGFEKFWVVPAGARTAREGCWKDGPGPVLFDALTEAFGRAAFVAEDLGIITDSVIALRKAYSLPGMQVLQFLVDRFDFDANAIEEDCVCYTGTHDNDTTAGWFAGSEGRMTGEALESLQEAVLHNVEGARDSIHKSMISLCFKTRARLAIAPLQDYLGLDSACRLNTPGQAKGNWRWRVTESDLDRDDLDYIADSAREYGRA